MASLRGVDSASGACDELCSTSRSLPGTSSSDPYRTVHSEAFSPVTFNAKEFVRPGVVGDALRESAERADRRQRRFLRTRHNLLNMEKSRETETLKKAMVETSRASAMVHEALRYEDFAFTRDLIDYHIKPGDMMQKKPNPALHQKIWMGSLGKATSPLAEDRDFVTTHCRSYPAHPLPSDKSAG